MTDMTKEALDACNSVLGELIDELEPAKEGAWKVRDALARMPNPFAEDERGQTHEMSDALRSIEAARHGLRDIARIAGEWRADLDDMQATNAHDNGDSA